MKIEISYNNGEKYTAFLVDESYENVIACLLDDDSVSVSHNMGRVVLDSLCKAEESE